MVRARNWREVRAEALKDGRITEAGIAASRRESLDRMAREDQKAGIHEATAGPVPPLQRLSEMTFDELQAKYPPADREVYDRAHALASHVSLRVRLCRAFWEWRYRRHGHPDGGDADGEPIGPIVWPDGCPNRNWGG